MDFAKSQSIGHHGQSVFVDVGKDMGGIEQFAVLQPAYCARNAIRPQDLLPKSRLMNPSEYLLGDVGTPSIAVGNRSRSCIESLHGIEANGEGHRRWIGSRDECRIGWAIRAWCQSPKVDQRHLMLKCSNESEVLAMVDVGQGPSPVAVAKPSIITDLVGVRTLLADLFWSGRNRQWDRHPTRDEDSLWPKEPDRFASETESLPEFGQWNDIAESPLQVVKVGECSPPDEPIGVAIHCPEV